jgi:hypothetical protein
VWAEPKYFQPGWDLYVKVNDWVSYRCNEKLGLLIAGIEEKYLHT